MKWSKKDTIETIVSIIVSAIVSAGLNPHNWGNGKARKKPREYRRIEKSPAGANCHGSGD